MKCHQDGIKLRAQLHCFRPNLIEIHTSVSQFDLTFDLSSDLAKIVSKCDSEADGVSN